MPNLARGSRNAFLYASPNPGALQLKSTFDSRSYPNPRRNFLAGSCPFRLRNPRHVNSYWLNGPAQHGFPAEDWKLAVPAAAAYMRRRIVPRHAARICQPIRIFSRRGIEQNSRALLSLRAQNHYSRKNLARLFRVAAGDRTVGVVKRRSENHRQRVRRDERGWKHAEKETVIETSTNFYASNLELGSIPPVLIHQLGRSRWIIDSEVFQTMTTEGHLKKPSVHQGRGQALMVLTWIRVLAFTLTLVFFHRQMRSHLRNCSLAFVIWRVDWLTSF
jgi:hypothetical protein